MFQANSLARHSWRTSWWECNLCFISYSCFIYYRKSLFNLNISFSVFILVLNVLSFRPCCFSVICFVYIPSLSSFRVTCLSVLVVSKAVAVEVAKSCSMGFLLAMVFQREIDGISGAKTFLVDGKDTRSL